MVRTIDATARRRLLAEAVWRIVLREGLAAASVRSVAAESGLSAGSVRHFFGTQRELIVFAMDELVATVGERVRRAAELVTDPEEQALTMLSELIPLTEATRAESFAWLQFVNQATFDPELAGPARASFDALRRTYVRVVELLRDAGRVPDGVDVPAAAATLGAVVDGVMLQLLLAPDLLTPDSARALVRAHLTTIGATS